MNAALSRLVTLLVAIGWLLATSIQPVIATERAPEMKPDAAWSPDGEKRPHPASATLRHSLADCAGLTGALSGRVTAADSGLPLASVAVLLHDNDLTVDSETTDDDGRYRFGNLAAGDYTVSFDPLQFSVDPTYAGEWYNDQSLQSTATAVAVTSGFTTTGVDALLDQGGVITGVITASDSGLPVSFLTVDVFDSDDNRVSTIFTNSQGRYRTEALRSGNYRLFFNRFRPYLSEYFTDKSSLETADLVTVNAPAVTANINATLALGGSITGAVSAEESGDPIAGVRVTLYTGDDNFTDLTSTDDHGAYTFVGLHTGEYTVGFSPSSAVSSDYLPEWYNDQTSETTATLVGVTAPNVTANINALLTRGGKISGRVTAADGGAGLANAGVEVYSNTGDWFDYTSTDEQGNFSTTALPGGVYRVHFYPSFDDKAYLPEWYNDQSSEATATPVTVTVPNTTSQIDAVLVRGGQISGRVSAADTQLALEDARITAYSLDGRLVQTAYTDFTGVYTMTALPSGTYKVQFDGGFGDFVNYAPEWYNGKADEATADPVVVTAPEITRNIDGALDRGGTLCGFVQGADGNQPLDDVDVEVYDLNGDELDSDRTDESGLFVFSGLLSGGYRLFVEPSDTGSARAYIPQWYDNQPAQATATIVNVTAPNTTQIGITLVKGGQISGRVSAADNGAGLEDVDIDIYSLSGSFLTSGDTDANGEYLSPGLAPGSYKVQFEPSSSGAAAAYALEWYNDKSGESTADAVAVTNGTVTPEINATLSPGSRISGRVTAADSGAGLDDVSVILYDASGGYVDGFSTNDAGYFQSRSQASGSYKLYFIPSSSGVAAAYLGEWYNDKASQDEADFLILTAPTPATEVNAVLSLGTAISGQVTDVVSGAGVTGAIVRAYDGNGTPVRAVITGSDGNYMLAVTAGVYRICFARSSSSTVPDSCYNGKPDLASADPITVNTGSPVVGINGVVQPQPSSASVQAYIPLLFGP